MRTDLITTHYEDVPVDVHEAIAQGVHEPTSSPEEVHKKKPRNYKLKTRSPLVTAGRVFKDSSRTRTRREKTKETQSRLLNQLLTKEGLDYMNRQVHHLHASIPTWDELYEHLDEWMVDGSYHEHTDIIRIAHPYEIATGNVDGKGTLGFDQVERTVINATDFVLDVWDEEYIPKKREQGKKGGMAFRKWSLKEYIETVGMSKAETAKHLGISTSTVANMRRYFKAEFAPTTQAEKS